jgi:putative PIN family toxin of toxin-antitoxin system
LNEYHEVLSRYYSESFADGIIDDILISKNSEPITVYYNWQLISADPDDNKFVDCAVSANADYIVTNDRHFNVLKEIDFPEINLLTINEFQKKI